MTERTVKIRNADGIHCRPAAALMVAAKGYTGRITIRRANEECALKSVLDLLALNLACGTQVTVQVEGPNEDALADRLAELLTTEFDFQR